VEPAILLLTRLHDRGPETISGRAVGGSMPEEFGAAWSSRCALLLWLSVLVLIPFDLKTVDAKSIETPNDSVLPFQASERNSGVPRIVQQLIHLCTQFLDDPGPTRLMACVLLSRLLTRPDTGVALDLFMR